MKYFNTITAKIESNLKIIIFTAIFIPVVDILYLSVFRQIYIDNYGINLTLADLFIIDVYKRQV